MSTSKVVDWDYIQNVGKDTLVYLASPYSAKLKDGTVDHETQALRAEQVSAAAALLAGMNVMVYTPIAHGHAINRYSTLDGSWEVWGRHCLRLLRTCDELWVLMLPGWAESRGVQAEVDEANKLGMTVMYVNPEDLLSDGHAGTASTLSYLVDRVLLLPTTEQQIICAVMNRQVSRLEDGQRQYGNWNVRDGRDWVEEALQECADALHYLEAERLLRRA